MDEYYPDMSVVILDIHRGTKSGEVLAVQPKMSLLPTLNGRYLSTLTVALGARRCCFYSFMSTSEMAMTKTPWTQQVIDRFFAGRKYPYPASVRRNCAVHFRCFDCSQRRYARVDDLHCCLHRSTCREGGSLSYPSESQRVASIRPWASWRSLSPWPPRTRNSPSRDGARR